MAWSTPSTQSAGYVVGAGDWNVLVNDLKYLKGQDGAISLEAALTAVGTSSTYAVTADSSEVSAASGVLLASRNGTSKWRIRLGSSNEYILEKSDGTAWLTVNQSAAATFAGDVTFEAATKKKLNSTTYTSALYVPLATPLTSTSFDGDSFSTVSVSTLIDLGTLFSVPDNVKAVHLRVMLRDSAAWGTDNLYFAMGPSATQYTGGVARTFGGDVLNDAHFVVSCDSDGNLYYRCNASGSNTLDVWIWVWGYWI